MLRRKDMFYWFLLNSIGIKQMKRINRSSVAQVYNQKVAWPNKPTVSISLNLWEKPLPRSTMKTSWSTNTKITQKTTSSLTLTCLRASGEPTSSLKVKNNADRRLWCCARWPAWKKNSTTLPSLNKWKFSNKTDWFLWPILFTNFPLILHYHWIL